MIEFRSLAMRESVLSLKVGAEIFVTKEINGDFKCDEVGHTSCW